MSKLAVTNPGELVNRTSAAAQKAIELSDDPAVEESVEKVVSPAVVAASAIAVLPTAWSALAAFLRYIFLQPLMLLGLRKRKGWGVVYNSVNKLPVDLAIVRLVDVETNKLIQSRVTDKEGRYFFQAAPGLYKLEVQKNGFVFPSHILNKVYTDGRKLDLYHGDTLEIEQDKNIVTPNIPIDPEGAKKIPKRIVIEQILRGAQKGLSGGGAALAGIAVYITPGAMTTTLFALQVGLLALFSRVAKTEKPKKWGTVKDRATGKPIKQAIVKLYTADYSRMVDVKVTDGSGKYAFLTGPNVYYITAEKKGYETAKTETIDVSRLDESFIVKEISLKPEETKEE